MGVIEGGPGRALVLTAALLGATGCAEIGDAIWQPRAPHARATVIEGEVRDVDVRRGRIRVRSARMGTRTLRVHRSTRVFHRRTEYTLAALEPGDLVRVRVEVDRSGTAWADRVDVRQGVEERRARERRERQHGRYAAARELEWIEGRVHRVDARDGWFTVDAGRHGVVIVHVPDRLPREHERRFDRIRRGDRVELEVLPIGRDEAELVRFL